MLAHELCLESELICKAHSFVKGPHLFVEQQSRRACALPWPYMLQQAYHAADHEHSCYNMFHNLVQTVKEMSTHMHNWNHWHQVLIPLLLLCMHVNSAHPMTVAW